MATQAVIAVRNRNKKRRAKSAATYGFTTSDPSWYQGFRVETTLPEQDVVSKIVKVQAAFRGYRGRKFANKVFQQKSQISLGGFMEVCHEIKQLTLGWRHLCKHFWLLLLCCLTAWSQLVYYLPTSYSVESYLRREIEAVSFNGDSGFEDVLETDDIYDFTRALIEQMYRPDQYFFRDGENASLCEFSDSECPSKEEYDRCQNVTEAGGRMGQFNRQQLGLIMYQRRLEVQKCSDNVVDLYTDIANVTQDYFSDHGCIAMGKRAETYESDYLDLHPEQRDAQVNGYSKPFKYAPNMGGFYAIADMGIYNLSASATKCIVDQLQELRWIDRRTERLCLAMITHNHNGLGRYAFFDLCFNLSPGGQIEPKLYIASSLAPTPDDQTLAIVFTSIYIVFICIALVVFAKKLVTYAGYGPSWHATLHVRKTSSVFKLLLEAGVLGLHCTAPILYFQFLGKISTQGGLFPSLDHKGLLTGLGNIVQMIEDFHTLRVIYAVLIVAMVFQLIAFLDFHDDVAIVGKTVRSAAKDLMSFAIVFGAVVLSFAYVGFLLFSNNGAPFSTFGNSVITLLLVSLTDFDRALQVIGSPLDDQSSVLGWIYFWAYVILSTLLLLNILLSIIVDSFVTFQERKRENTRIPLGQSFLVTVYVLMYDIQYFWFPKCCCCCKNISLKKKTGPDTLENGGSTPMPPTPGGESPAPPGTKHGNIFHKRDDVELGDVNQSFYARPEEMVRFNAAPHTFLEKLKHMQNNSQAQVPTWIVRKQFREVFPERLTEKLLALLRERTARRQPRFDQGELEMFYEKREARYIISELRKALSKLDQLPTQVATRISSGDTSVRSINRNGLGSPRSSASSYKSVHHMLEMIDEGKQYQGKVSREHLGQANGSQSNNGNCNATDKGGLMSPPQDEGRHQEEEDSFEEAFKFKTPHDKTITLVKVKKRPVSMEPLCSPSSAITQSQIDAEFDSTDVEEEGTDLEEQYEDDDDDDNEEEEAKRREAEAKKIVKDRESI